MRSTATIRERHRTRRIPGRSPASSHRSYSFASLWSAAATLPLSLPAKPGSLAMATSIMHTKTARKDSRNTRHMGIGHISRHRGTALLLGEHQGNLVVEAPSDRAERPMRAAPTRRSAVRLRFLRADLGLGAPGSSLAASARPLIALQYPRLYSVNEMAPRRRQAGARRSQCGVASEACLRHSAMVVAASWPADAPNPARLSPPSRGRLLGAPSVVSTHFLPEQDVFFDPVLWHKNVIPRRPVPSAFDL